MATTYTRLGKPLLSVEEAAELLGHSRSSFYRAIERGDLPLPVFSIAGRYRIPRHAVDQLIRGERPTEPAQPDPATFDTP